MTTLTIRIDNTLKNKASKEAEKLGVPLTLIIKNALVNFVESPKIVIGEPEMIIVDAPLQEKMDKIAAKLAKK